MKINMGNKSAKITAIGYHLAENRKSNSDLGAFSKANPNIVFEKIGVKYRAIKTEGQKCSDFCIEAFQHLIAKKNIFLNNVGILCVVTQNPDYRIPHTSAIVHSKIGLGKNCITFDISQGCSGFPQAIAIVSSMMEKYGVSDALVFTSDQYSEIIDEEDLNTAFIFGDGATASHLSMQDEGYRILDVDMGTIGSAYDCIICDKHLRMNGSEVLINAGREVPESILKLLERNKFEIGDIDEFIIHQGSKRIVELISQRIGIRGDCAKFLAENYGNTVSSSIPILLSEKITGEPRRIVISGFGIGFTWASCILEKIKKRG